MVYRHCLMLSLVCLPFVRFARAHAPSWDEKFRAERARAFGSIAAHSTQEVKRFLLLEGRPRSVAPTLSPVIVVPEPMMSAEPDEGKPEVIKKIPRPKKPAKTKTKMERIPIEALIERARRAHASGRLDEAQRYYRLVKKADPNSVEAAEKLEQLRKEME